MRGDRGPLERLCGELGPGLYRYAFTLTRSEADAWDAVQDVFTRLLAPELYEKICAMDAGDRRRYLVVMVRNRCVDLMRARAHTADELDADEADGAPGPEERTLATLDRERMRAAVRKLPEKYRRYIHMKYYMGIDGEALARELGVKPDTLRTLQKRAVERLRALMGEEETADAKGK